MVVAHGCHASILGAAVISSVLGVATGTVDNIRVSEQPSLLMWALREVCI